MELKFLGTGNQTCVGNYHSNALLTADDGKRLLIDCGSDIKRSIVGTCKWQDLQDVYISHLHDDHCGGLQQLALVTHFTPGCQKPRLHMNQHLVSPLWNFLCPGLATLEGEEAEMETFFDVQRVTDKTMAFQWADVCFQLVQTMHVMNAFRIAHSYGLVFPFGNETVFFTTDTQFNPHQIRRFYDMADVIFHDCETTKFKSGVHAHYDDLLTLPEATRAKMWLYHYADGELPNAAKDGFRGFVYPNDAFESAAGCLHPARAVG